VSRDNIRALQTWINQQPGCNAGTVDGVYGPNTRRGLECAAAATSWVNVTGRFPFVNTLIADPTGATRPADMVFDPGTSAKTPEQGGVQTGGGGGAVVASRDAGGPSVVQEAGMLSSIFGALPWWGWLGIAGGVGLLAVLGVALMKGGEDEAEAAPGGMKANWTACPMCGSGMVKKVGTEGGKPIHECQTCDYVWAK
jgi:hypothetical protein